MVELPNVMEGAPVYGSAGGCLGYAAGLEGGALAVDCVGVRGARLHVPLDWVAGVEDGGGLVRLSRTCNEVRADWPTVQGGDG
jgi:hypothetical protein